MPLAKLHKYTIPMHISTNLSAILNLKNKYIKKENVTSYFIFPVFPHFPHPFLFLLLCSFLGPLLILIFFFNHLATVNFLPYLFFLIFLSFCYFLILDYILYFYSFSDSFFHLCLFLLPLPLKIFIKAFYFCDFTL